MKVVATFSILGDLAREVGGDAVDVTTFVGPDSDAHTYQPKPTDARALAGAKVLVSNGLGFEGWIDRLAEAAGFEGQRVVASAGAPADSDPHCWQDVACARRYVANIADGLAAADPANATLYAKHAAAYDERLATLDAWIRREIAAVPEARRQAITGHTSFRYFARAYDVRFSAPTGYSTDRRADRAGRRQPDPPGARAEDQGAVHREHDQPRTGRRDRPRLRRQRRPAPLQRRPLEARRSRPNLRGDDAPQRDRPGSGMQKN